MIYLNGKYVSEQDAKIEHNDRGFLLSDGLFETLRCYDGVISNFSDHFERLKSSADKLKIPFTISLNELEQITYSLLEKNELIGKNASLRITLTRGTGPRGLLPPDNLKPTLMIAAFPYAHLEAKPSKVVISNIRRNESSPLSRIKSLCYLDNILARQQALQSGADDCILLNTKGHVTCGSVSNIFIITSKGIMTPKIEDGVLPGITRKNIINLCKANKIPVFEESIDKETLLNAKEVFFTNRLIEIQPVIQIDSQLINSGKIGATVLFLKSLYKQHVHNQKIDAADEQSHKLSIRSML